MSNLEQWMAERSGDFFDVVSSNCWHFVFGYFDKYHETDLVTEIEFYTERERKEIAASKKLFLQEIGTVLAKNGFVRAKEGKPDNIAVLESLSEGGRFTLGIRNEYDDIIAVSSAGVCSYPCDFEDTEQEWRLA